MNYKQYIVTNSDGYISVVTVRDPRLPVILDFPYLKEVYETFNDLLSLARIKKYSIKEITC